MLQEVRKVLGHKNKILHSGVMVSIQLSES